MKKISCFILAAACLLTACSKTEEPSAGSLPANGEVLLSVSLGTPSGATKVGSQTPTNEKTIRNVQVFVFRGGTGGDAGNLEIAASTGFTQQLENAVGTFSGLTVRCTAGWREVWVVVNDSEDRTAGANAVATKGDFLALTHELQYSTPSKLLMIGHSGTAEDAAVLLTEGQAELQIGVRRLAASVILESVKNDFDAPAYRKAGVFRLESCYLLNVPGRIDFGERSAPSALATADWYARLAPETAPPRSDLLYDSLAGQLLNYGQTYTVPHTFYTYPNDCAVSEDATWSARATLLVLEASVYNGHSWLKYYYPVQLGAGPLCSNKQYRVNLTIHRPGSLDPNQGVRFEDVTPVIQVSDWTGGDVYSPEI